MKRLLQTLAFAADKHRNQRRKDADASPYINHPIALANVLANEGGIEDERVLMAAILHDTIEDTETTDAELEKLFGQEVKNIGNCSALNQSVAEGHFPVVLGRGNGRG